MCILFVDPESVRVMGSRVPNMVNIIIRNANVQPQTGYGNVT